MQSHLCGSGRVRSAGTHYSVPPYCVLVAHIAFFVLLIQLPFILPCGVCFRARARLQQAYNGGDLQHAPPYKYSLAAISNVMSSWFQYEALKFVSFPLQVLSKSSKVILVQMSAIRWCSRICLADIVYLGLCLSVICFFAYCVCVCVLCSGVCVLSVCCGRSGHPASHAFNSFLCSFVVHSRACSVC